MALRTYKSVAPNIGERCYIDDSSVLVGDVTLGDDSSIWPLVAARGDVNKIQIGERTNVQDGSVLHVTRRTTQFPEGFPLIIEMTSPWDINVCCTAVSWEIEFSLVWVRLLWTEPLSKTMCLSAQGL